MTTPSIRRAADDDAEAAVRVWQRARWDARQPHLQGASSPDDDLRHFRDVVMRDDDVWLAVDDDAVIGLLAIAMDDGRIDQLHVDPTHQGRGIGSALLEHAKALAPRGLTLVTYRGNEPARTFYEGRGFRAVAFGTSPSPENEPEVTYAWDPADGE